MGAFTMTSRTITRSGLLLVWIFASLGLARAGDEGQLKILEPADGATVIRREVRVIAQVASDMNVGTAKVVATADGEKPVKISLEPVGGRAGCYEAKVPVPSSGKIKLKVTVGDKDRSSTATVTVEAKRGINVTEVWGPGHPIPAVTAMTTSGDDVVIDSKKGPVLIHFYSAWDDCKLELEWLAKLEKRFGKKGLTIVGVGSVEPKDYDAWEKYLAKMGAKWKNVPDPDGAVAKNWNDCSHEVAGCQASGCMTYVMSDGKIAGGDYMAYDYVGTLERCSTEDALAKIFK
jgi:peroxiredoxin